MSEIKFSLTFDKLDEVQVKKAFDVLMVWFNNDRGLVLEKMEHPTIAELNADNWQIELQKKVEVHQEWQVGIYLTKGKTVRYNGVVYNVVKSIEVVDPNHTPDVTLAHYRPMPVIYPGQRYPRWSSRGLLDSVNYWELGEKVEHNGEEWESEHAENIWEPGVSQWTKLDEATEPPVNACDGVQVWNESDHWTTYTLGDKRVDEGKLYECHNVGYSYFKPSGSSGHFGWTFIQDCN